MMFEVFTVFVPCWLVVRHHIMRKRAADSNAKWESASQSTLRASGSLEWKSASAVEKGLTIDVLHKELGDRLFTMSALDHVLNENPRPLQDFSALRDFSGENIAFLTNVTAWKSAWPLGATEDQIRDAFTRALVIYTDFISPRDAEFPINVASKDLKYLEDIFERPARIVCGEARVDSATPFAVDKQPRNGGVDSDGTSSDDSWIELGEMAGRIQYAGEISSAFDVSVFDRAQAHIKYLVLTNTWPKFVTEIQQQRRSEESERSGNTGRSGSTIGGRVTKAIQSLF